MSTELQFTESNEREFSAGGVVLRGDEVLVIVPTRRTPAGDRALALPKGHLEMDETAPQAAAREVREEAGVSGVVMESLGTVQYGYVRHGSQVQKTVEFFLIDYREGDPADHDDEVQEARWMKLSEAATALTFPGEREIIQRLRSLRHESR
ncbi:MAG: NUDIX hydrolase [Solirubrobacteraceae bacterium]